jgi:hypothetical protein
MIRAAALAAALVLPAGLAAAADLFQPPAGCAAFLTVQHRDCIVTHHYTCEAAPGHRWRVDLDGDGIVFVSRIDAEAQWIESEDGDGVTFTLLPARNPISIGNLLATGFDDYDFEQIDPFGNRIRVQGFDRLTGGQVMIGGEVLLNSEFSWTMTTEDGAVFLSARGSEYVSVRHGQFFSRKSEWLVAGQDAPFFRDHGPVAFFEPGAPGFLALSPTQGCTLDMAALALPLSALPDGELP